MDKHTYPTLERPLQSGDGVLIYTDGITEAEGKGREQYGDKRLLESARHHLAEAPDSLLNAMAADTEAFTAGMGFDDDVCMVVAEVFGFPKD
jgi:sigma-B regulation protein RsbU (phosphoserine phosphatase)